MKEHNPTPDTMTSQDFSKDSHSDRTIQKVRALFLAGHKLTALSINQLCQTNDARKIISDLRNKEGWNIKDVRLGNQSKLYWLDSMDNQLSLF